MLERSCPHQLEEADRNPWPEVLSRYIQIKEEGGGGLDKWEIRGQEPMPNQEEQRGMEVKLCGT